MSRRRRYVTTTSRRQHCDGLTTICRRHDDDRRTACRRLGDVATRPRRRPAGATPVIRPGSYGFHPHAAYVMDPGLNIPFESHLVIHTAASVCVSSCLALYPTFFVQWRQQSLHPCSSKMTSGSVLLELFRTTGLLFPIHYPQLNYVLCAAQV